MRRHAVDVALILAAVALGVAGILYVITHQDARPKLPWDDQAFRLYAEFENAQGVAPGQGQSVRVAGVQIGLIGAAELHEGRARVSMNLQPEYAGYVRGDSTALLRPKTVLKDQFVEIDPGTQALPALKAGDTIPVSRTKPDVNTDEILASLDSDTRTNLRLLLQGLGKGLAGQGGNLRKVLKRFPTLHDRYLRVSRAFSSNRRQLARAISNYRILTEELAERDEQLRQFVTQSGRFFAATAPKEQRIAEAVLELPTALDRTTVAIDEFGELSRVAGPALEALRPAARHTHDANVASLPVSREGTPILRDLVRPFVRSATPYLRTTASGARALTQATPDLTKSFALINRLLNMLAYNPGGGETLTGNLEVDRNREEGYLYWLAWTAQVTNSVLSMADGQGVMRRTILLQSCDLIKSAIAAEPALEPILGVTDILDDNKACATP